jgi:hypothetical protein
MMAEITVMGGLMGALIVRHAYNSKKTLFLHTSEKDEGY